MKKLYLAFYSICIFLAACTGNEIENNEEYLPQSKEALSPVGEESLMLYFNSTADFFQTFHQLLIEDENAQLKWVSNKNFEALLSNTQLCTDSTMLSMPKAFQALFNKDLKVNINDSIIHYNQGNLYVIEINNKKLKSPILCGNGNIDLIQVPTTRTVSGHVGFDEGNGLNHQYEFKRPQSKYKYKYVNQLRSYRIIINRQASAILAFMIKFEYKYSAGWKNAGLPRNLSIQLSAGASVQGNGILAYHELFPFNSGYVANYNNITDPHEVPLARVDFDNNLNRWIWDVAIGGRITQVVVGESNTSWTDIW